MHYRSPAKSIKSHIWDSAQAQFWLKFPSNNKIFLLWWFDFRILGLALNSKTPLIKLIFIRKSSKAYIIKVDRSIEWVLKHVSNTMYGRLESYYMKLYMVMFLAPTYNEQTLLYKIIRKHLKRKTISEKENCLMI